MKMLCKRLKRSWMQNEFKVDSFKPMHLKGLNSKLDAAIGKRLVQIEKNAKSSKYRNEGIFGKLKILLHLD